MKKIIICTCILLSTIIDTAKGQTEQLYHFGKIWGLLKYFHPASAAGKIDMDSLLFRLYPQVITSGRKDFNALCLQAIRNMGPIDIPPKPLLRTEKFSFDENHNLSWISDTSFLDKILSDQLKEIVGSRIPGPSWYAQPQPQMKFFVAANEKLYKDQWKEYPDPAQRIMVLFRFWNMIEYFFPYKYMTDKKWDEVLRNSIPSFTNSVDAYSYHLAVAMLITSIDDSHAGYTNETIINKRFTYLFPFEFTIANDTAIVTELYNDSLASENGIQKKDIVVSIDDKPVRQLVNDLLPISGGSNYNAKVRTMKTTGYLIADSSQESKLGILKNGKVEYKLVRRYRSKELKFPDFIKAKAAKPKMLPGNILYAELFGVTEKEVHKMMKTGSDARAMIFDLRGLPPLVIDPICSYLTRESIHFSSAFIQDFTFPGYYKWVDEMSLAPDKKRKLFHRPVFVLVNEYTQSQSEFTAMAIRVCPNVKIIGSQTAGADGNSTRLNLPGLSPFAVTWTGLSYPDKSPAQRVGVQLDIEVKPTAAGIAEGRDEILERAVLEAMK